MPVDAFLLDSSLRSTKLWFCFSINLHHKVQWEAENLQLPLSLDTRDIFQSSGELHVVGWGTAQNQGASLGCTQLQAPILASQ